MSFYGENKPSTLIFIGNSDRVSTKKSNSAIFSDRTDVRERDIRGAGEKPELIEELSELVSEKDEAHRMLSQKAALLLDEMLENAIYAAPRSSEGKPLYVKGVHRTLQPEERVKLRYSYDGKVMTMEVSDNWGTLRPAEVFKFLACNSENDLPDADRAGRGLFFMWKLFDQFYVSIVPGKETVVGGMLHLEK